MNHRFTTRNEKSVLKELRLLYCICYIYLKRISQFLGKRSRSSITVFLIAVILNTHPTVGLCQRQAEFKSISGSSNHTIRQKIDSLLGDPKLAPCFIGLKIVSLTNDSILYSKNSHKLFHPASNMKLLTTAAALSFLSQDYQFHTRLYINSKIEKGVLQGDLFIQGGGDPLISTADIDTLVSQLAHLNINKIRGNIVGDISIFDDVYWGAGWMWDDEPEAYEAFISPLTVNSNSIKFILHPEKKKGEKLRYELDPDIKFYKILNTGITSDDTTIPKVKVTRPKHMNNFTITGRLAQKDTSEEISVSIWRPELYFLNLFKERLSTRGISVEGKCITGIAKQKNLLRELIHPLDSVVHLINKPSDNLAAENLLKTLGKEKYGKPGTSENGLLAIKSYLSHCGIDTSLVILADGSGLSFYNEISPDVLIAILKNQYKQKAFNRFFESLPIAGVDGTLKSRMKGTKAENNVHAKTGSLNGVSALSGYLTTADGSLLCFSFLCGHMPGDNRIIRNVQDKIMDILANMRLK